MADPIVISGVPLTAGATLPPGVSLPPGTQLATISQAESLVGSGQTAVTLSNGQTAWVISSNASDAVSTANNNIVTTGGTNTTTGSGTGSTNNAPTTGTGGVNASIPQSSDPAPTPGGIKHAIDTTPIPNPLHAFPSWTYNWSLWWLSVEDANAICGTTDAGPANDHILTLGKSFCIAEDAGVYPGYRAPAQGGLNYNIQEVKFDSLVGLNSTTKTSNLVSGSMTVAEPYGVTFLNTLISTSFNSEKQVFENYIEQPYMLQLDFVGYDEAGVPLPKGSTTVYRKRFPIRLTKMGIRVTKHGAEYDIGFIGHHHRALQNSELRTVPANFDISAGTVKEFFTELKEKINKYYRDRVADQNIQYADSVEFDMDKTILDSKIVYSGQVSLAQSNTKSVTLDLSKNHFAISGGTPITEVIDRVLLQSEYVIKQLGIDVKTTDVTLSAAQTNKFNFFKILCRTTLVGVSRSGQEEFGAFDNARNVRPIRFTFNVHQYPIYDGNHPFLPPFLDPGKNVVKNYNYIYTGKNTDIINLKIDFNTLFYTDVASYINRSASSNNSPQRGAFELRDNASAIFVTPQLLTAFGVTALGQIPNLTPMMLKMQTNDRRDNLGFNIQTNPNSQASANMAKSLYSKYPSGDMLNVEIEIVGDPTLIKQDDVLYTPSPTTGTVYNSWDTQGQAQFASQFGHVRMDNGELIVHLNIDTPIDLDLDYAGGNKGLMAPTLGTYPSLFNGRYKVIKIKNVFKNGQFTQVLNLVRLKHEAYLQAGAGIPDSDRQGYATDGKGNGIY